MKYLSKTLSALFLSSVLLSCAKKDDTVTIGDNTPTPTPLEWSLEWEDNFNNSELPDWTYWESGAYNNEIQLYQKENLDVSDGILTISSTRKDIKGNTTPYDDTEKDFEYTSGRIETKKFYGRTSADDTGIYKFVAKIQLPKGAGMWPAFWSYGDPWPTRGEIDILEARGEDVKKFQSNLFYGSEANKVLTSSTYTEKHYELDSDLTEGFHEYSMTWSKDSIVIRLDDELLHKYITDSNNYIDKMHSQQIVLNLAVGGAFFTDKDSKNYADNAEMKVDWIKVYKLK